MENVSTFLTPLSLSVLLLVTLNVITKSITTLIRGEGGKCVLTIRMSEMTKNIVSISFILQLLVALLSFLFPPLDLVT